MAALNDGSRWGFRRKIQEWMPWGSGDTAWGFHVQYQGSGQERASETDMAANQRRPPDTDLVKGAGVAATGEEACRGLRNREREEHDRVTSTTRKHRAISIIALPTRRIDVHMIPAAVQSTQAVRGSDKRFSTPNPVSLDPGLL